MTCTTHVIHFTDAVMPDSVMVTGELFLQLFWPGNSVHKILCCCVAEEKSHGELVPGHQPPGLGSSSSLSESSSDSSSSSSDTSDSESA